MFCGFCALPCITQTQAKHWDQEKVSVVVTLHKAERLKAKNEASGMSCPYARLLLLNLWQTPVELFCFKVKNDTLQPEWKTISKNGTNEPTRCTFKIFKEEIDFSMAEFGPEICLDLWDFQPCHNRGLDRFLGRNCIEFIAREKVKLPLKGRSRNRNGKRQDASRSNVSGLIIVSMQIALEENDGADKHGRDSAESSNHQEMEKKMSELESSPKVTKAVTLMQRTWRSLMGSNRRSLMRSNRRSLMGNQTSHSYCTLSLPSAPSVQTDLTNPRDLFEEYIPSVSS